MNNLEKCLRGNSQCYPRSSFCNVDDLELGTVLEEPLRSADGKIHKVTVSKCKFPECL